MPLSAAKKAYRQQPAEREKRLKFWREYRQRPEVKAREAERARRRRSTQEGAAINQAQVKADRKELGRAYIGSLLTESTGIPQREIPEEIISMKREQLQLKRLATSMENAVNDERNAHESLTNND